MAEDVQGIDPVAWLNRDDVRTEFALEDGGTLTSSEIVERMRMAYECSKDFSGPVSAIDSVAYALVSGDPGYTGPHLSESAVKALANRTAHDDGERERFMARLKLDSDDYTPLSEILTDNRTYRNLHAVVWLVAREGWEAAQNL